jgi:hypothetical protein
LEIASKLGFELIRFVLFGRQVVIQCLETALYLRRRTSNTDSDRPSDSHVSSRYGTHQQKKQKTQKKFLESTERKPFPGEAENTVQGQPFFSCWKELYRFFLTPLEEDHPFRCSAGESANDRLHNVGELWSEWREYVLRIRFKDSEHPKRSAKRMSKRSPNARNTGHELTPGIHRPAWYFSNLILYRSKQARAPSDWRVCLAWLTNRREDLTFSIDPLLDMGPRNPPRILLHFQEGILDRQVDENSPLLSNTAKVEWIKA